MAAGDSAMRRAQEARRRERRLREQVAAARLEAERWEAGSEGERRIAAHLLVLTEHGWRLLVDRHWPGTRSANMDMLLVGPGGVYVVDVKHWRSAPTVADGRLSAGGRPCDPEVGKLLAMTATVERSMARLGMSPVAVPPLMAFAGQRVEARVGRVRLLGEHQLVPALLREPTRLSAEMVRAVGDHLEREFPVYEDSSLPKRPRRHVPQAPDTRPEAAADDTLFDVRSVNEALFEAARREPIEQWMTFLAPAQLGLVRRRWSGPARISGPAGTGKTVVGLHRAAHLAQRTTKRVLYVTFANNLPRVQSSLLRIMSPSAADRMDFRSLHAWARDFLRERDIPVRLDVGRAETAFSLAWKHVGRDSCLAEIDPAPGYWREEIHHVIKGRGLTTFPQYAAVRRHRRLTSLRRPHREAVWALYERYERIRVEREVHDFGDVLSLALVEAGRRPERSPYAAVVVDEVQDLTLVGVRLLHALVGDQPDGLLLIGDGQQAVYPGGYRLSDAGIDIRGDRGQVLRVNYRNAEEILDRAMAMVADDPFEDIDGTPVIGRPQVETTYRDGRVIQVEGRTAAEHDRLLLDDLRERTADHWPDTAVLCPSNQAIAHYRRLLADGRIPVCPLEQYEGRPVPGVKLGSYVKAKGLEFRHVYLPRHDDHLSRGGAIGDAVARERAALARSQLFVAMTRARDTLWLGGIRPAAADAVDGG